MKQQAILKSPIKDVNKCLNGVRNCFNPFHPLFSPCSRVVNHFSSRISFHSSSFSSDKDLYQYLQSLNHTFRMSQVLSNSTTIIVDSGIKTSHVATAVAHIWSNNTIIKQL